MKSYPAHLSLTTLICLMGALEGALVTFAMERGNVSIWILRKGPTLFVVLYGVSYFSYVKVFPSVLSGRLT